MLKLKFFVIGIIILLIVSTCFGIAITSNNTDNSNSMIDIFSIRIFPIITFMKNGDTLIVISASSISSTTGDLDWSNIDVGDSQCIIPSGTIHAGDVITNCSGVITLRWIPSNTLIGYWNF